MQGRNEKIYACVGNTHIGKLVSIKPIQSIVSLYS